MKTASQLKGRPPRNVLIADDDQGVRAVVSFYFTALDCTPFTCPNIQCALDRLSTHHYDLVVLDLYLGDEPGMEVLRWMRDHQLRIPTVLMSGSEDIFAVEQARRLGIIEFWPKPTRFQAAHHLTQRLWSADGAVGAFRLGEPRNNSTRTGVDVIQRPRTSAHP